VSKNLTKKQKTLIKDYFENTFDELLEHDFGKRAVNILVATMLTELKIHLSLNRRGADVAYCNGVISMFERILASDSLKTEEEKEVASE